MDALREAVDAAEVLCENWPVPNYNELVFSHQTEFAEADIVA